MARHTRKPLGAAVARRPWTRAERRVVLRGFLGRLTIAIEPMIVAVFFAVLPVALLLRRQEVALLMAPVFALVAVAFFVFAIVMIAPSAHAVLETFEPIYTVDGYVRYRATETSPPQYYVAVLDADRVTLGEWPLRQWPASIGQRLMWPVVVEFSEYGGIHKIDGRSTGVLPTEIAPFGVGIAARDAERNAGTEPRESPFT
ncbi:MAG TPA: hypothetical protein VK669_07740 [Candidatus Limnocylindrales bacterium]|nr:hypothetical protein [Candidatus Limnocylindrales bacterium]